MRLIEMPLEHVVVVDTGVVHIVPMWLIRQIANGIYDPTPEQIRILAKIVVTELSDRE
jgi:hypothetical protein